MPLLTGRPLVLATVLVSVLIIGTAVAYRFGAARLFEPREELTPVIFQPLEGTLADRTLFKLQQEIGENPLSTTLPVSVSYQVIPLALGIGEPTEHAHQYDEGDAHVMSEPVSATSGLLVRYSNPQVCDAQGRCPIALFSQSAGANPIQSLIFQVTAKSLQVSSRKTKGNPDLLIDYGDGTPPLRMVWDEEGMFPGYSPVAPSAAPPSERE